MKVHIGPYTNFIGPYQIAYFLQHFGISKNRCDQIGDLLYKIPYLNDICNLIYEKLDRKEKIIINDFDPSWIQYRKILENIHQYNTEHLNDR